MTPQEKNSANPKKNLTCKYCKKYERKTNRPLHIADNKCKWNTKVVCFRYESVCKKMVLEYVKKEKFKKGKEDKWTKHKAVKNENDDLQCGGHGYKDRQHDSDWIEVGATNSSTIKIKAAASLLPNNNTYILLSDKHGPRKTKTTHTTPQPSNIDAIDKTAIPIERKYTMTETLDHRKTKQDCKLKQRKHCR